MREKIIAGLDVRVILRDVGNTHDMMEALKLFGFPDDHLSHFKLQRGCHNKGIIIDSDKVVVGSHNWSGDGTLQNRDASIVFYDGEIASYYKKFLDYDWERLAKQYLPESNQPILIAEPSLEEPVGMVRVPWSAYYES